MPGSHSEVPRWEIGAYCVSKAAVLHFTRCLAMELAQYGITVNVYSPGVVHTPMWEAMRLAGSRSERGTDMLPAYGSGGPPTQS